MRKVLIFGTFDGIHKGHLSFIRQARRQGDRLIIVVARDSNVRKTKGRMPMSDENSRLRQVKGLADEVMIGEKRVTYKIIKKVRPDVICIGYDQRPSMAEARDILKRIGMEKVKLRKMKPYMPGRYKSSRLNKSR